jgi:hypothetical protein
MIDSCCSNPAERYDDVPLGHCLSRARFCRLCESEGIVVRNASVPLGLAAYKRADGEIRVVHELLLDRTLAGTDPAKVTDVLLSALEMTAYEDGVTCLTFLLHDDVVLAPFEERGYVVLVLDGKGVWLQRKLGWPGWCEGRSERKH